MWGSPVFKRRQGFVVKAANHYLHHMKKIFPFAGFSIGTFALILQLYLIVVNAIAKDINLFSETWRFFSYMTIWTNIYVALCFAADAFHSPVLRFFRKPVIQACAFINILVVGVTYHLLLANIWAPQGWQYVADVLLHYAMPALFILYWLILVEKNKLEYSSVFTWMIYPGVYFVYSLLRGLITKTYPYPFVDVNELGYPTVLFNSFVLLIVYVLLGLGTVALSRRLVKKINLRAHEDAQRI